ncbi:MAG: radical SAM protein [Dichotomicrobium sp.]
MHGTQDAHQAPLRQTQGKFTHPDRTATGEPRAKVALHRLDTLWINTGTLCNIECANCYIESSPTNDRLAYFSAEDARAVYDEIAELGLATREIGFTGGEPFMNRDMIEMAREALARGFTVLILTNAMRPMQRARVKEGLLALQRDYGAQFTIRVSLDHYSAEYHDTERGAGSFASSCRGLEWLAQNGFNVSIAGRSMWDEPEAEARAGFARLIAERGWPVDADDPSRLVLFPEMDEKADMPEITESCWGILGKSPDSVMCASSRMIVKRKGADKPTVLPCTLLPYDTAFEMGASLRESFAADGGMFDNGAVKLCHPHCAKFCVLGGASCSG